MRYRHLVGVVAGALLLAACNPIMTETTQTETMVQETATGDETMMETNGNVTIMLSEQSNLGQSGQATLTETADGQVMVVLDMMGGNFISPQPAHIHSGACPSPGPVVFPLTNVVNGMSQTTLDVTMDELMQSAPTLAINVHKSEAEPGTYTACGDLTVN